MSVTAAEGFVAAGCHAGIKRRRFDMALLATDDGRPVPCAAVFTQNYGEAGALELLGRGLPPVVSGHNSYFTWGAPRAPGSSCAIPSRRPTIPPRSRGCCRATCARPTTCAS